MLLPPLHILRELIVGPKKFLRVVQVPKFLVSEQGVDLGMALTAHPEEIPLVMLQVLVLVP